MDGLSQAHLTGCLSQVHPTGGLSQVTRGMILGKTTPCAGLGQATTLVGLLAWAKSPIWHAWDRLVWRDWDGTPLRLVWALDCSLGKLGRGHPFGWVRTGKPFSRLRTKWPLRDAGIAKKFELLFLFNGQCWHENTISTI